MGQIAKRKTTETWREAVTARSGGDLRCLASFDEQLAAGRTEAEAAYQALKASGLLWDIAGLDETGPRSPTAEAAQARNPHEVPNV